MNTNNPSSLTSFLCGITFDVSFKFNIYEMILNNAEKHVQSKQNKVLFVDPKNAGINQYIDQWHSQINLTEILLSTVIEVIIMTS